MPNEVDIRFYHPLISSLMESNLQKRDTHSNRSIVNILGIPGLLFIIWVGGWLFSLFVWIVVFIALFEYFKVLQGHQLAPRVLPAYLATIAILLVFTLSFISAEQTGRSGLPGQQFLIILVLLLITVQTTELFFNTGTAWTNISATVLGTLWIGVFLGTLVLIRNFEFPSVTNDVDSARRLTLALFTGVWLCDSLAYIFGKKYGRKKLLPLVSPNKTVIGALAGFAGVVVFYLSLGWSDLLPRAIFTTPHLLALGVITGVFGQAGDFVESRFKRDFDVKDSGRFLMGHGGVLDRFDSLLFTAPLTYIFLLLAV